MLIGRSIRIGPRDAAACDSHGDNTEVRMNFDATDRAVAEMLGW
jgi:hypothetical protein